MRVLQIAVAGMSFARSSNRDMAVVAKLWQGYLYSNEITALCQYFLQLMHFAANVCIPEQCKRFKSLRV